MKNLTSAQIRQMFLDFFKEKGHSVEPSASLVPFEDPTLLWINSGVATLKKYFDGRVVPDNPRICNAQKSIRTNDIENVGKTARHHTFFEMLGNFSIGDYFKEESIIWAWEFLTDEKWIGFDPEKLSVTIHPEDDEAFDLWNKKVGLPKERIIRLEENFWDIGEGPSGPNTEIFYDRGEAFGNDPNDPELFPGGENERYLEIWNLVFSQYNHNPDGSYTPLPKKNIDTGMGLERMACVIQDAPTNFETDLFMPLIKQVEKLSGVKYDMHSENTMPFKVIADHIRTVTFAVADGALPSNEGRGYVLRRLLRRAVRFAKQLGIERPFMYELVPLVGEIMVAFYPEVKEKQEFIQKVVKTEEERFHETLNDGEAIFSELKKKAIEDGSKLISGKDAFRLYDTYGFPYELTEEYAEEAGLSVDRAGFEAEMESQRERARSARQDVDSMQIQSGVLSDIHVDSEFVGYDTLHVETEVAALLQNNEYAESLSEGTEGQLMLSKTPFYAESGGQVADQGTIKGENFTAQVLSVKKAPNGQHLHSIKVVEGSISQGVKATATIDGSKRNDIVKNHTATHLLHQALKDVLGAHVNQAGSLVSPDRLRFDFSHFGSVTVEEMEKIEQIVNEKIWANIAVDISNKSLQEAKDMGAMALFGEKYGDVVRVVKVADYSLELCGGCHVRNTSEIGLFKLVSESGIGAGTRRIEAVTGKNAYVEMNGQIGLLKEAAAQLKTNVKEVPAKVEMLQQQMKQLQRENESLHAKLSNAEAGQLVNEVQSINGVSVLAKQVDASDMNAIRTMVDELKQKLAPAVVVLGAVNGDKVNIVAGVSADLISQGYHAGKIVKEVATRCGGGGGGRPDMAQAGGKNPDQLNDALNAVIEHIKNV